MDQEKTGVIYCFAHMGINCNAPGEAAELAETFRRIFGFPGFDIGNSVIVGGPFEIVKQNGRGRFGHIGIETDDVEAAVKDLEERGIELVRESAQQDAEGRLVSIYLKEEIGGFAVHLLRKMQR